MARMTGRVLRCPSPARSWPDIILFPLTLYLLLFPPFLLPPSSQVTPNTFNMQQFDVTLEINSFNKKAGSSNKDETGDKFKFNNSFGHLAMTPWPPGNLAPWPPGPPGFLATWPCGHLATWPPGRQA